MLLIALIIQDVFKYRFTEAIFRLNFFLLQKPSICYVNRRWIMAKFVKASHAEYTNVSMKMFPQNDRNMRQTYPGIINLPFYV